MYGQTDLGTCAHRSHPIIVSHTMGRFQQFCRLACLKFIVYQKKSCIHYISRHGYMVHVDAFALDMSAHYWSLWVIY